MYVYQVKTKEEEWVWKGQSRFDEMLEGMLTEIPDWKCEDSANVPGRAFLVCRGNKVNGDRVSVRIKVFILRDLSETLLIMINLNALFNILNLHIFMQLFKSVY